MVMGTMLPSIHAFIFGINSWVHRPLTELSNLRGNFPCFPLLAKRWTGSQDTVLKSQTLSDVSLLHSQVNFKFDKNLVKVDLLRNAFLLTYSFIFFFIFRLIKLRGEFLEINDLIQQHSDIPNMRWLPNITAPNPYCYISFLFAVILLQLLPLQYIQ